MKRNKLFQESLTKVPDKVKKEVDQQFRDADLVEAAAKLYPFGKSDNDKSTIELFRKIWINASKSEAARDYWLNIFIETFKNLGISYSKEYIIKLIKKEE